MRQKKHSDRMKNSTEKGARFQHLSCCQQWGEVGLWYNHAFLDQGYIRKAISKQVQMGDSSSVRLSKAGTQDSL